jgi:uncharacterized membrane protein
MPATLALSSTLGLALTVVVIAGAFVVVLAIIAGRKERAGRAEAPPATVAERAEDRASALRNLTDLHVQGIITDEEYERNRRRLTGS